MKIILILLMFSLSAFGEVKPPKVEGPKVEDYILPGKWKYTYIEEYYGKPKKEYVTEEVIIKKIDTNKFLEISKNQIMEFTIKANEPFGMFVYMSNYKGKSRYFNVVANSSIYDGKGIIFNYIVTEERSPLITTSQYYIFVTTIKQNKSKTSREFYTHIYKDKNGDKISHPSEIIGRLICYANLEAI